MALAASERLPPIQSCRLRRDRPIGEPPALVRPQMGRQGPSRCSLLQARRANRPQSPPIGTGEGAHLAGTVISPRLVHNSPPTARRFLQGSAGA